MPQHVERLFSEAYDSMLSASQRARFDEHLAACPQCRTAFDDYRVALSAVSELHTARMPVAVVLPASPPQMETTAASRWRALLAALIQPRGMAAAAGVAVVAVAAVTIAVRVNHGSNSPTNLTQGTAFNAGGQSSSSASDKANALAPGAAAALAPACTPRSVTTFSAPPSNYSNGTVVSATSRPGEQLLVATAQRSYSPGSTVLVYARLQATGAQSPAYVPCVSLNEPGIVPSLANPPSGAAAFPRDSGGADLLTLTIPAETPRGTVLHIIASIPSGVPSTGDSGILTADLTITVN
jgi:anti-sigma factor RsiW